MALEHLWAPWRGEYVKGLRGDEEASGCLFCELQKQEDEEALILERSEHSFAVLNRYPYNSGHLMVAPLRHVGKLEDVEDDENLDMQRLLQRCIRALKEAMKPDGFNLGMNLGRVAGAGVPDHLHWHVVPRWNGDTNFMPTVGSTKVLPLSLESALRQLQNKLT
jgi:ATP adenylyltransferase